MKKWLDEPRNLFGLLMAASVIAILLGLYLGLALGILPAESNLMRMTRSSYAAAAMDDVPDFTLLTRLVTGVGMMLWCVAWGAFFGLCRRLHRGGRNPAHRTAAPAAAAAGYFAASCCGWSYTRLRRPPEIRW